MSEAKFRIWSDYHKAWWRPNNSGYTIYRSAAGVYVDSEIYTRRDKPIPVEDPWDYHEESKRETARIEAVARAERAEAEVAALRGVVATVRGWAEGAEDNAPVYGNAGEHVGALLREALADGGIEWNSEDAQKTSRTNPRWAPREIADRLMQRDEVDRLKAQLAEARRLRLRRGPTLAEVDDHEPKGGLWLIEIDGTGFFEETRMTLANMSEAALSVITDAIPLDADGQPCPVGGWPKGTP